jgi:predicted metal-dependent hydrolase
MLRLLRKNTSSPPHPDYLDITHAGETFRIALKRIASARRFTLRVRAGTCDAVLTIPQRSSLADAHAFAERHAAWVSVRLTRLPKRVPFAAGEVVPFRGILHLIIHDPASRSTVWVKPATQDAQDADEDAMPRLCVGGEAPHVARRILDFFKREAKRDLDAAVLRHTASLGLATRRITLRDTTSRWGSCSSSGTLNFCWRLIMAPPYILDYLAAHEVAHLIHMNHSAHFWKVTHSLSPDTERAEAWLKAQGSHLLRFGPGKA